MRILIAGGCGFVGSSLAVFLKTKYPAYTILVLDNLIRKGSVLNIPRLRAHQISVLEGDIRDPQMVDALPAVDVIVDAAAEPSVLSGIINSPKYVIETNFGGTSNLIQSAQKHNALFLFLSTSRVYPFGALNGIPHEEGETRFTFAEGYDTPGFSKLGIDEDFITHGPKSFYGVSKFAAENILFEYEAFYDLKFIINRFGVIAGPHQMGKVDQGIIMHWLASHYWKKPLTYLGFNGSGKQVRDILHVRDACEIMDLQIHEPQLYQGSIWNIGGGIKHSISLFELTTICQDITGNKVEMNRNNSNRPADVRIYQTNNQRITRTSGWHPTSSVVRCVEDTFQWISDNHASLSPMYQ